jgi:hypothetical protein
MTENGLTVAEDQAFREKQSRFYALVGHCILRFQHVEGYLEDVFAAVLGGSKDRADAIFASVRRVARCAFERVIIDGELPDRSARWPRTP